MDISLGPGTVLHSPGLALEVLEWSPEILIMMGTYAPNSPPPPLHFHPTQTEKIVVLEGALEATIGGARTVFEAERIIEVPCGVPHTMNNPFPSPARTLWEVRPALQTLEFLADIQRSKGVLPKILLLAKYEDVFRLGGLARAFQFLIRAVAWLAERIGHPRQPVRGAPNG